MDFKGVTWKIRLVWLGYLLIQQITAITAGFAISELFTRDITALMTWHRVLSALGTGFLMFEAMLVFGSFNHLTMGYKKKRLDYIHAIVASLGLILLTIGVLFAIVAKPRPTHFATLHSKIGLAGWIICLVASLAGTLTLYSNFIESVVPPLWLKFGHVLVGLIGFVLNVFANASGFYKGYPKYPATEVTIILLTSLSASFVVILSSKTLFSLTKSVLHMN